MLSPLYARSAPPSIEELQDEIEDYQEPMDTEEEGNDGTKEDSEKSEENMKDAVADKATKGDEELNKVVAAEKAYDDNEKCEMDEAAEDEEPTDNPAVAKKVEVTEDDDEMSEMGETTEESTNAAEGKGVDDGQTKGTVTDEATKDDELSKDTAAETTGVEGKEDEDEKSKMDEEAKVDEEHTKDAEDMSDTDDFDMMPQIDATSLRVCAGSNFNVTVFGKDKKRVEAIKPFEIEDLIVLGEQHESHTDEDGKTVYTVKFSFRIQTVGRFEVLKCGYEYLHVTVVPGPVFVPKSSWSPEDDKKIGVIGHVCPVGGRVRYIFHPRDEFGNPTTIDKDFIDSLSISNDEEDIKLEVECMDDNGVRLSFIPQKECLVQCTVLFCGKESPLFSPISIVALRRSTLQGLESSYSMVTSLKCLYHIFHGHGLENEPHYGTECKLSVDEKSVIVFRGWRCFYTYIFPQFSISQFLETTIEPSRDPEVVLLTLKQRPNMELQVEIPRDSALRVVAATRIALIKKSHCGSMQRRIEMVRNNLLSILGTNKCTDITTTRERILKKAMELFSNRSSQKQLLSQTSVTFDGEEAIDVGGPSKEFFTTLYTMLFGPEGGLWTTPDVAIRYPSPAPSKSLESSSGPTAEAGGEGSLVPFAFTTEPFTPNPLPSKDLRYLYDLCGVLAARAVADYILGRNMPQIPYPIASSVFKFILSQPVEDADLQHDDPAYWRTKVQCIKDNSIDGVGVTFDEDLFTMDNAWIGSVPIHPRDKRYYGLCHTARDIVDLSSGKKPESMEVSDQTKQLYLEELAKYRLQGAMKEHLTWFRDGFVRTLGTENAMSFTPEEYMTMCCSTAGIDVEDLRAHAVFPYDSPVVGWLWQALATFSESEKQKFLMFVTGRLSPPSGGFKDLRPSFTIRVTINPVSELPVSHTCFNVLELPAYHSYQDLFAKLLIAINDGNGSFGIE